MVQRWVVTRATARVTWLRTPQVTRPERNRRFSAPADIVPAGARFGTLFVAMMVHLYDYEVPAADVASGIPNLRIALEGLAVTDRKALLGGLFKQERMPGTMERLTTLVADLDLAWTDALTVLDNGTRIRRFVAIDEAKAVLDRFLPPSAVAGTHDWDVARLHEPYGDGTYHGRLLKRTRKQLRSVGTRDALTTPFLLRREWAAW